MQLSVEDVDGAPNVDVGDVDVVRLGAPQEWASVFKIKLAERLK